MRTGELVRVSGAVSNASGASNPRIFSAELPQTNLHVCKDKIRPRAPQRGILYTNRIGRCNPSMLARWLSCKKIANRLTRCTVTACQLKRTAFDLPLKCHAAQRITSRKIRRIDGHHDSRIGIASVPRVITHAVGDNGMRFALCRDNLSARTHTKRMSMRGRFPDATACIPPEAVRDVPPVCRTSWRLSLPVNVRCGHQRKKALAPDTHRCAADVQRCRARCDQSPKSDGRRQFPVRQSRQQSARRCGLRTPVGDSTAKINLSSQANDFFAHRAHNALENVRADVRLCFVQNFFRCTVLDKGPQHHSLIGSLMRVVSLPSEYAPAPPSPN